METNLHSDWKTGAHVQTSGIHRGMETRTNTRAGHLDGGEGAMKVDEEYFPTH